MTEKSSPRGVVIALAGRRIDAPGASQRRFPAENVELVFNRIHAFFEERKPSALVSSAASGADLLAIAAARELGIARHIILPFAAPDFRQTSVADRGGDWGRRFDEEMARLGDTETPICLNDSRRDNQAYKATNVEILKQARQLASAQGTSVQALIVWNGAARQTEDNTNEFANAARNAEIGVAEILTL